MPAEWYYTTNKQQMGPVTWNELRELVESGIVKPHDMVWTEGMDEWVKAIQQHGLFDDEGISETPTKKKSKSKPPPGRRKSTEEEEEDDEEDEREAKRKARKAAEERAKTGVYVKVGLIVGGIVLFLTVCVVCGGFGVYWVTRGGGGGGGPADKVRANYTVSNLLQNRDTHRDFRFTQGRRVVITVTNDAQFPQPDVDLYVHQGGNNQPLIGDIDVPNAQNRNCRVEFVVRATDNYRVRLVNLGPGTARRCVVNVEEQ